MPAATQEAFIDMRVKDVRKALGTPNPDAYVVLLEERGGDRRLPIWIGHEQALGLALRLEGAEVARPLTCDLMASAIAALGGRVRAVRIDRLSEGTFYATVVLEGPEGTAEVDATVLNLFATGRIGSSLKNFGLRAEDLDACAEAAAARPPSPTPAPPPASPAPASAPRRNRLNSASLPRFRSQPIHLPSRSFQRRTRWKR